MNKVADMHNEYFNKENTEFSRTFRYFRKTISTSAELITCYIHLSSLFRSSQYSHNLHFLQENIYTFHEEISFL